MVGLALEPRELVNEVEMQSHQVSGEDPPELLRRPATPPAPLPSIRESAELGAVHEQWRQVHGRPGRTAAPAGLRGVARSRIEAIAVDAVGTAQDDDRALIGDLVRAVDAVAGRCDELAGRIGALEGLVEEIVHVFSGDLTRIRAALARPADDVRTIRDGGGGGASEPGASTGNG